MTAARVVLRMPLVCLDDDRVDLVDDVLTAMLDLPYTATFRDALAAPGDALRHAVLAETTPVAVGPRRSLRHDAPHSLRVQLSRQALSAVYQEITDQRMPTLHRNPTARRVGDAVRFLPSSGRAAARLRRSPAVDAVLDRCPATRSELVESLLQLSPDADPEALDAFLAGLLRVGVILQTDRQPQVGQVVEALGAADLPAAATALTDLDRALRTVSSVADLARWQVNDGWGAYTTAIPGLAQVPAAARVDIETGAGPADWQVDRETVEAAARASAMLGALPGAAFHTFAQEFRTRYGDASVPLAELADPDFGLLRPGRDWPGRDTTSIAVEALTRWLRMGVPVDLADMVTLPVHAATGWASLYLLDHNTPGCSAVLTRSSRVSPAQATSDVPLDSILVTVTATDDVVLSDSRTDAVISHPPKASTADPLGEALTQLLALSETGWSWGALVRLPHLPRVVYGETIIAPERWLVDRETLSDSADALRGLLTGLGTRRWLGLIEPDRVLPFDSTDVAAVRAILDALHEATTLAFVELPQLEHPAIATAHGSRCAELIIEYPGPVSGPVVVFDRDAQPHGTGVRYSCPAAGSAEVVAAVRARAETMIEDSVIDAWGYDRDEPDSLVVTVRPVKGERHRAIAELLELGMELRSACLVGGVALLDWGPLVAVCGGYDAAALIAELEWGDSADVASFLADKPDLSTRLSRAVHDVLTWVQGTGWDLPTRLRLLSATYAATVVDNVAVFRAVRQSQVRTDPVDPPAKHVARLWRSVVDAVPGHDMWPSTGLPSLVAVLRRHCARLFPTDHDQWTAVVCELAIRALRDDPGGVRA